MPLTLDVIIPTYNRPAHAARVAASILPQLGPGDSLYVVWQGNAKPDLAEADTVHLVRSDLPSLPRARNTGVKQGRGAIIVFLDDDVEPGPGLIESHRSSYTREDIGAVAGSIDDPLFPKGNPVIAEFDWTTGHLVQNFYGHASGPTISLMGANMSFRRDALAAIGGFDENFLHNALMEEVDAAFRLRNAGYSIWYCSEAQVNHVRDSTGGCRMDTKPTYLYHQFANVGYFAARHASRKFWGSWFTYWKYRLEFESRKKVLWMKHDPLLVAAGVFGAGMGIVRYVFWGRKGEGQVQVLS
jgi:GT2 family glycosyltransferase